MLKVNDKVWCFDEQVMTPIIGVITEVDKDSGFYFKVKLDGSEIDFFKDEVYKYPEDKNELLEHLKTRKKSIEYMIKDIEQM